MKVKSKSEVARLCPTLSDPMDCSLPGSSVHGIFQARVLEWGAIAFSISHSVMSNSLPLCGLQPNRLLCSWDSPAKNTGHGCHSLLQGILQTQGWKPGLQYWLADSPSPSNQGSPLGVWKRLNRPSPLKSMNITDRSLCVFVVLFFTLKSLSHLELIFIQG